MSGKGQKFYVVFRGRQPGIYYSWDDCRSQVLCFKNNKHQRYPTLKEAQAALHAYFAKADANEGEEDDYEGHTQSSHKDHGDCSSGIPLGASSPVQTGCNLSYVACIILEILLIVPSVVVVSLGILT